MVLWAVATAVLLVVAAFTAGRLTGAPVPEAQPRQPMPGAPASWLPRVDAPGSDIPDLPRYPGSVRVDFDRQGTSALIVTDVDYLTTASTTHVQRFYRERFGSRGWEVLDIGFLRGEWSFLLRRRDTEVTVEIARRGPLVEVDIEQSRPSALQR
jgi:hypothetical protein